MRYKVQVIDRETGKIEAEVGNNLNDYYAEKVLADTQKLVDLEKYEVKVINAF